MTEVRTPPVYAGIIDDIGRKQYSGKLSWLREYVQNAIDSGSDTIFLSLKDADFEIIDKGSGMSRNILVTQAFGIGKSFKGPKDIGELGIGMYAGSGICDRIAVRTKMKDKPAIIATVNMKLYRELLKENPSMKFNEMMENILTIEESEEDFTTEYNSESFTHIRFEDLSRDTVYLIEGENLENFIEKTVNLPLSDEFNHKKDVDRFIGNLSRTINVRLEENGTSIEVKKFKPNATEFADTFWSKDIMDQYGKLVGKIWATYNKSGTSLEDARILLKRKGITIGDESYVASKFKAKYSPRFFGEIVILDDSIEINTSRDWFISGERLNSFVEKAREALNDLYSIADFDSKNGVRIVNLINTNLRLENKIDQLSSEGNLGLANQKRDEVTSNIEKIEKKIETAMRYKKRVEEGKIDLSDPTNGLKYEIVERTLSSMEVKNFKREPTKNRSQPVILKDVKHTLPQTLNTLLKQEIIDSELAESVYKMDANEVTDLAFALIGQRLKMKIGKSGFQGNEGIKELIQIFNKKFVPPEYAGFSREEQSKAFRQVLEGLHVILTPSSNNKFADYGNGTRDQLEVIMLTDFILKWIDRCEEI